MKDLRAVRKITVRLTSVLLILSVVSLMTSCWKLDFDYIFVMSSLSDNHCFSISNDSIEELSRFQITNTIEAQYPEYSESEYVSGIMNITATGDDPSEWEYLDEYGNPLDPELELVWIGRMLAMDLPYTGKLDVIFYEFDDYSIVYAGKFVTSEMQHRQTIAVFHNDTMIGTIDTGGLVSGVYKHN